jgi:two-component system cell cycle sensor histidine kinase/response regulator CckA
MFGASGAIMSAKSLLSVIPNEGRKEAEAHLRAALATGDINSHEFQHRDEHGQPRTLAFTASPILDEHGKSIGALACFRDITNRTRLQAELAKKDHMTALGRMAGALAHHYNNILGGVVTGIDFALASDNPALKQRALQQTGEALGRVARLTDSLLAFAEGDQRHGDQCDLTELILSVADYMETEMADQNVTLKLELGHIPVTSVPRAQLVTVVENILHNAVDAMPKGGTATLRTMADEYGVKMSITDTGCGMDEDQIGKVFEPFYSTKAGESFDFEHHPGLGLTVAHGILHVLGHSIAIESAPHQPTTVAIRFNPRTA